MKPLVLPISFIVMIALFAVTMTHRVAVQATSAKHTGAAFIAQAIVPTRVKPIHRAKAKTNAADDMGLTGSPEAALPSNTTYSAAQDVRNVSVATGDTSYTSGEETEKKKQKMGYTSAGTLENAAGTSSTVTIPRPAGDNGQNPY